MVQTEKGQGMILMVVTHERKQSALLRVKISPGAQRFYHLENISTNPDTLCLLHYRFCWKQSNFQPHRWLSMEAVIIQSREQHNHTKTPSRMKWTGLLYPHYSWPVHGHCNGRSQHGTWDLTAVRPQFLASTRRPVHSDAHVNLTSSVDTSSLCAEHRHGPRPRFITCFQTQLRHGTQVLAELRSTP